MAAATTKITKTVTAPANPDIHTWEEIVIRRTTTTGRTITMDQTITMVTVRRVLLTWAVAIHRATLATTIITTITTLTVHLDTRTLAGVAHTRATITIACTGPTATTITTGTTVIATGKSKRPKAATLMVSPTIYFSPLRQNLAKSLISVKKFANETSQWVSK